MRFVEAAACQAMSQAKIAELLDVDVKTLRRHYRRELDVGAAVVQAELIGDLLRIAGGKDGVAFKAIRFCLEARFGWSPYAPRPR